MQYIMKGDTLMIDYAGGEALGQAFLAKETWAVVGVSANSEKFGYKVYKALAEKWHVYPINPKLTEIDGVHCFADLTDLPETPDVVNIITPPAITLEIVKECKVLGIKRVWMQPGAESADAIAYCRANQIDVVFQSCAMVEAKNFKK